MRSNDEVVQLYTSGYLKQAQDSRDISEYAYKRGAASLLDFLDAERSYRAAQLAYRQALASYMTALEQIEASGRDEEPAMKMWNHKARAATIECVSVIVPSFVLSCAGLCWLRRPEIGYAGQTLTARRTPIIPNCSPFRPDQMSHVQVLTVQPTTLTRTLRLTGAVAYNGFHTTPVITQVSGPVSRIVVVPGQKVHQGQPMLYVASPDYSQLRTNYLKAKDAYALAQKSLARAKDLYEHHAIADKDLEQAESAEVQAGGDLASAEAALKVMGITDPDAVGEGACRRIEVPVKAPIGGEVVEQTVAAGQLLQPGATQCFMISDTSTVWVLVNVYQKDLPYVRVGDTVTIQTDAYPESFHGRISYVAASLDPSTRTLQARIETRNPGEKLKKDMYVAPP